VGCLCVHVQPSALINSTLCIQHIKKMIHHGFHNCVKTFEHRDKEHRLDFVACEEPRAGGTASATSSWRGLAVPTAAHVIAWTAAEEGRWRSPAAKASSHSRRRSGVVWPGRAPTEEGGGGAGIRGGDFGSLRIIYMGRGIQSVWSLEKRTVRHGTVFHDIGDQ